MHDDPLDTAERIKRIRALIDRLGEEITESSRDRQLLDHLALEAERLAQAIRTQLIFRDR